MQLTLRNLGLQCPLTDLHDERMRPEVVEEELEQSQRLQLCHNLLMRLMVVVEEVVVKVATQGEALESLTYFSSSFPPEPYLDQSPHFHLDGWSPAELHMLLGGQHVPCYSSPLTWDD
ncbi:hypothetical protein Tco_0170781 [Tanacetum coccineum]